MSSFSVYYNTRQKAGIYLQSFKNSVQVKSFVLCRFVTNSETTPPPASCLLKDVGLQKSTENAQSIRHMSQCQCHSFSRQVHATEKRSGHLPDTVKKPKYWNLKVWCLEPQKHFCCLNTAALNAFVLHYLCKEITQVYDNESQKYISSF